MEARVTGVATGIVVDPGENYALLTVGEWTEQTNSTCWWVAVEGSDAVGIAMNAAAIFTSIIVDGHVLAAKPGACLRYMRATTLALVETAAS